MDVVDRATRSRMMSGIRGKDTKPELAVRSFLHRAGLRFRLHARLPGKPDLVLPRYRTAVFVHGCFWHRHEGCRYATTPASNVEFWQEKFAANVQRDARAKQQLEEAGWRVETVWACQLGEAELSRLADRIRNNAPGERD
ncbi:very short patch repair endonuclease [Luteimonas soli]|uniref:Very short patch repair endonuclease n=1 Tax=Luteimonas soli TaxID=1648966 RepID=A0ABV7XK15_9GAMM